MRKAQAWFDSNDVAHLTREECQKAELEIIFQSSDGHADTSLWATGEIANWIMEHSQAILDVITLRDNSRPGARGKPKGKRKPTAAELPLEGKAA